MLYHYQVAIKFQDNQFTEEVISSVRSYTVDLVHDAYMLPEGYQALRLER